MSYHEDMIEPSFRRASMIISRTHKSLEDRRAAVPAQRGGRLRCVLEHELEVWVGGPVEPERSWILLNDDRADEDAVRICDGVYLSTSASVLRQIIDHSADSRTRLVAGYAGWGPGQLDAEIAASAWLSMDVALDIVFGTPADEMWNAAIRRLGATPGGLQTGQGVH